MKVTQQLHDHGQHLWPDNITRGLFFSERQFGHDSSTNALIRRYRQFRTRRRSHNDRHHLCLFNRAEG